MSAIGQLVKREREKRGWTQRQLAIYAGVSNTAISDTESGKSPRPSADLLVKVSRGLGIDVAPLLVATGYLEPASAPKERFVTVPIIGIIRAGPPLMAIQEEDGGEEVPEHTVKSDGYYFLRVRGDSMTGMGIMPGSLVLVRPTVEVPSGTVAVVIENRDDACVKIVKFDGDRVILRSANPDYPDRKLQCADVQVIGEVVEIRTKLPLPLHRL